MLKTNSITLDLYSVLTPDLSSVILSVFHIGPYHTMGTLRLKCLHYALHLYKVLLWS